MRVRETTLRDAYLIETVRHDDERGYFARLRCAQEFELAGLPNKFVQTNLSANTKKGTFRGLHYQLPPSREGKLVRCLTGAIDDVIVDLRPDSETFLKAEWFTLSSDNLRALFVPHGFAHGFLTAVEGATVLYEMTDYFRPELSAGIRWSDPQLKLKLPGEIRMINDRDASYASIDLEYLQILASCDN